MHRCWLVGCLLIVLGLLPTGASAAGIDCSNARSPTEKAICGSPSLLALDRAVANAYAGHLAQHPEPADQARQELIAWLKHRDAVCSVAAAARESCLERELTTRLAALAKPVVAAAPPPPSASPPITPPALAMPVEHEPAVPSGANPPAASATLEAATLPAQPEAATLLHVTSPGRFSIAAHSASGAALQLVDRLAGPSDIVGSAGSQDGRLDVLLDIGTYKLRVVSAAAATGTVALSLTAFADAAPRRRCRCRATGLMQRWRTASSAPSG